MKIKLPKKIFFAIIIFCGCFLQAQTVTGKVTSSNLPLPGASIIVKGTNNGSSSDFDGNYTINNVPSNAILVISYLGYVTREVAVEGRSVVDVSLEEDENALSEVVVVGYGTKKKSVVTGAISSVSSKQFESASNQRVEQVLQGRVSGVTVSSSSGSPGQGAQIRIRGAGSSGNSEPLYIVDGMKTSSIVDIAPSDIANIEILKDAASAAIYGTEGANGVVLITTKAGRTGELKLSFNTQIGTQFANTDLELMDASQFVQYMNEAGFTNVVDNGVNTNWLDETFTNATIQRYDINASGGGEKTNYYASASVLDQDGIVGGKNSNFRRTTFRFNIKSQVANWLELGANSTVSFSDRNGITENNDTRGVIQNALILDPLTPVFYGDGQVPQSVIDNSANAGDNGVPLLTNSNGRVYGYPTYSTGEVVNPLALANAINNNTFDSSNFLTTLYAKFSILEGLNFTTRYGYERSIDENISTSNPYFVSSEASNTAYNGSQNVFKTNRWLWENFASYDKSFGKHNFSLLVGYSAEERNVVQPISRSGSIAIEDFNGFDFDLPELNEFNNITFPFKDNLVSTFGRLSYNFDDKYLFEGSLRADRSDKFPTANKTGVFPAASIGWVASKENFWGDDPIFDFFKVRASWGENGSRANLGGNSDQTFIITTLNGLGIDYLGNVGAQISGFANENLVWETSEQLNFGIDLRALDNRLRFTTEYYKKTTRDLIVLDGGLITPGSAGFTSNSFNAGTIVNQGLEFEVGYSDSTDSGFRYSINANLSTLDNEVTEILFVPEGTSLVGAGAPQNPDGVTRFAEGQPAWSFFGFETDGIDPATGEVIRVDTNGDNVIDNNDKTFIGSPHPDVLYGGNINLGYKNFDFNLQFQGTIGNEIFSTYHQPSRPLSNKPEHFYTERWTGPGDTNANFPGALNVNDAYDSDLVLEDGTYMRIKQIQLGYTLPESITSKLKMSNTRIYVSLDDFFTFTKYRGLDPEVGNFGFNSVGVDRGYYPTAAKLIFGLSVNF
ncbi:putative TonB-linked outer membrane protein [Flavobacteriales bacterium ALC-1]|nr:putative TonB-linked outer membrane protein [Flavobacteriales bacterium ALC-1]